MKPKPRDDFLTNFRSRRSCKRKHRRMSKLFDDIPEREVVGPEVVTPFADAVRLIDDEERWLRFLEFLQSFGFA